MEDNCENDVAVMLDKLDKMLDTSDKSHTDDPEVQEMLHEQHNLIRELSKKFKFSVYKGVVMEARNANLLNENEALQLEITEERQKVVQIQKKLHLLEETATTFSKIKEEYEELTLSLKEGVMSFQKINETEKPEMEDKATSCDGLSTRPRAESGTQTMFPSDCVKCRFGDQQQTSTEPTIVLTQTDLARLDDDMKALKESLKDREKSWQKMEKRDKMQRAKICRLDTELVTSKETANNRKQELENKAILIKNLEAQIKKMQDMAGSKKPVRKTVVKKRTSGTSKSPPPQTTTVAHLHSPAGEGGVDTLTTPSEPARPAPRRPPNKTTAASVSVPSHVLTSDSRLTSLSTSKARVNLAKSPGREFPKRNRSRLTTPHANTRLSPQRSLNINLKDN